VPEDKYLDIRDLDAGYGRSQVLFGVTLNVPWRGGVAILGRNGAGKTTLMKAIVGELPLLGGSIMLDSRDVGQLPTEKRIRLGVGYVPQEHAVFARLSVRDNLAVGAMTNRDSRAVNRILEIFPKLGQRMDQVAGTLSGGERKMLAIGRALLSDPRLLLLDEPTEGVWIGVIEEITEPPCRAGKGNCGCDRRAASRSGLAGRQPRLRARPRTRCAGGICGGGSP